jgi:hypothetical protein
MKRVVHPLLFAAIAVACSCTSDSHRAPEERASSSGELTSVVKTDQLTDDDFWALALQYAPRKINLTFNDALENRPLAPALDTGRATARLAIGLVLLKQYNYHLTCCNQSYNLLNQDTPSDSLLVARFAQFYNCSAGNKMFLPSSCAYEWMNSQRDTLGVEPALTLLKEVDAHVRRLRP